MEGFFSETDIYTHTDRVLYRLCSAGHCKQFRTASVSDFSEYICRITLLITINFIIQLMTDFLSAGFVDRIGYRASMLIAHAASAAGLICLPLLPELLPDPFAGLLIAVGIYAVGGGLLEVLVSPVVEALPTKNKEKTMSMLHSFYCWGHVAVVLLSTVFFALFGVENWRIMAVLWALVPIYNLFVFCKVPMCTLTEEGEKGLSFADLVRRPAFWILMSAKRSEI